MSVSGIVPTLAPMQLSVVIVSYNVCHFLEQALLSVERAVAGMEAEVWVVDNNSVDSSVGMVRAKFPWVRLIANDHNPGFSVANNQAIRRSSGEHVLLLNPDTVVEEDTFQKCYAFMRDHPEAGALGVRMIDGTGRFLPESKRSLPTPWVAFTKAFGLARLFPKSEKFGRYHLGFLDEHSVHQVGALAGAYMWVRSSAIASVGPLDEAFFMYGEDIDWSYRIELGGYKNYYFPGTTIIHYKGESTKRGSLNYVRVFYQAMIIFAQKHFAGSQAGMLVWMMRLAIYVRAVMTVLGNVWAALKFPLLDALGIYVGLRAIKHLWAIYHFGDAGYFSDTINYVHFPAYTLMWLGCVFLGGGYDRPYDLGRLLRSLGLGTLILFSIYGLLPEYLRPSRALLLLGAAWAATWMLLVRAATHLLKYGNLAFATDAPPRLAIVGGPEETDRALSLLQRAGARRNYLGRIAPGSFAGDTTTIGTAERLTELVDIFHVEEVLFCSSDLSNRSIQGWMSHLGPKLAYRILPSDSTSIIGSQGKNARGSLYTLDAGWAIDEPTNRRGKWLLDKLLSSLLLITLPIHILFTHNTRYSPRNTWYVLTGRRTWVGYAPGAEGAELLPRLQPGIINSASHAAIHDAETLRHLNTFYARDYTVWTDVALLLTR